MQQPLPAHARGDDEDIEVFVHDGSWSKREGKPYIPTLYGRAEVVLHDSRFLWLCITCKNHPDHKARQRRWARRLLKDKVGALIKETRQACVGQPQAPAVEEELGYFNRNIQRMQYGSFRGV